MPAAALALLVDLALWGAQRRTTRRRGSRSLRGPLAVAGLCGALLFGAWAWWPGAAADVVVVGSKNFAEQLVLAEIVAQVIERDAGLRVDRRLNLGGTLICEQRAC